MLPFLLLFMDNHETTCILHSTDMGAAYGTAKSGVGISSMGVMNPQLVSVRVGLIPSPPPAMEYENMHLISLFIY